jgi:DNA-binding NarL/FixJ family response regulator
VRGIWFSVGVRPTRIMLVDDDPSARFLLRTILGDHPEEFDVVAETGRASEALDLLRETNPDVALLDAMMPMTDGYEVAGQLREVRPDIRLVLLTSYVDEEVRNRAHSAQIDATLDKGEYDQVPRVVREVVSREPGATAAPG